MSDVRLLEVKHRFGQAEGDNGFYQVTLRINGRRRKFNANTFSMTRAVELAYFFWTGNRVVWDRGTEPWRESIFSDEKADPMDFEDLNQVPFWSSDEDMT